MSRPRWSVPSKCSRFGWPSVYAALVAIGSCVCKSSAKTAVTSISAPPAAPSGFFRTKRATTVHAPGCRRAPGGTAIAAGLTAIPNSRVEDAVQHVHDEVGDDHDDRGEHDEVLDHRIVTPQDRLNQEPRDAGQVEDGLGDHEPADEERELDPDDGDDGQQGVLERVTPDDDAPGLSLRPRRPDVVLAHHLEQGRARDTHD